MSTILTRSRASRRITSSEDRNESSDYISREELERIIEELRIKQQEEILKIREEAIELAKEAAVVATREAVRAAFAEINISRSNAQSSVIVPTSNACNCACATSSLPPIAALSATSRVVENSCPVVSQRDSSISISESRLELDTYDGSSSWNQYVKQFEMVAEYNRYSEEEKVVVLVSSLRGSARVILQNLSDEELRDFRKVKEELDFSFGEEHFSQISYSKFHNRKQGENEGLVSFALDLKRLVRLAYSGCNEETKDQVTCQQFISGIVDSEVRIILRLEGVSSLREALHRAKQVQAINGIEKIEREKECKSKKDSKKSITIGLNKSTTDLLCEQVSKHSENRSCWYCGEENHIKKVCPHRRRSV